MEEVEKNLEESGTRNAHYIWNLMSESLEKRGIKWKSIGVMNPKVKFD